MEINMFCRHGNDPTWIEVRKNVAGLANAIIKREVQMCGDVTM